MNKVGINIGASKESIAELGAVIQNILILRASDQVTIEALRTLREGTVVHNTQVENCRFDMGTPVHSEVN